MDAVTAKALNLRPVGVGVIPPALNIGIVMKRLPPAAAKAIASVIVPPPIPPTPPALPAGSDVWYDAPNNSVIPYQNWAQAFCLDTPNNGFGVDVPGGGDAPESDMFDEGVETLTASAWWQLTVPPGNGCLLMVDTVASEGGILNGDGSDIATYQTDTNILIVTSTDWPAAPFTSANMKFDKLVAKPFTSINSSGGNWQNDDISGAATSTRFPFLSQMSTWLPGGSGIVASPPLYDAPPHNQPITYWIRVDTWGGEAAMGTNYQDGMIYRLRVTLIPLPSPT